MPEDMTARAPWEADLVPDVLAAAERGDRIVISQPRQSGSAFVTPSQADRQPHPDVMGTSAHSREVES